MQPTSSSLSILSSPAERVEGLESVQERQLMSSCTPVARGSTPTGASGATLFQHNINPLSAPSPASPSPVSIATSIRKRDSLAPQPPPSPPHPSVTSRGSLEDTLTRSLVILIIPHFIPVTRGLYSNPTPERNAYRIGSRGRRRRPRRRRRAISARFYSWPRFPSRRSRTEWQAGVG